MENKIKFSKNVILVDVAFLNEVAYNVRKYMNVRLERELSDIDLPTWVSYLCLDAGLQEGDNEVQVLLVTDKVSQQLNCCQPSELESLNGVACRTPLGEFLFSVVPAEGFVSTEQLYLELMELALDSAEVDRLMLVSLPPVYGDKVEEGLREFFRGKSEEEGRRAVYFTMEKPLEPIFCSWSSISYPLGRAFGIQFDEL